MACNCRGGPNCCFRGDDTIAQETTILHYPEKNYPIETIEATLANMLCKNGLHYLITSDARLKDGECRLCSRARKRKYEQTEKGKKVRARSRFNRNKRVITNRIISKRVQIFNLERELYHG